MMDRRRALMGAKKEDLILSDLLTLDGIKNTRNGHNASATVWEDLSGNGHDTNKVSGAGNLAWAKNHSVYDATNRGQFISHNFFTGRTTGTIELVIDVTGNGSSNQYGYYRGELLDSMSSGSGLAIYTYNTGGVSAYVSSSSMGYSSTGGKPLYVAYTLSGNTAKRYVNGALADTKSITYSDLNKSLLRIGFASGGNDVLTFFPNAKVYRIGIDSSAFTAEEIADRYSRFVQRFGLT